MKCEHPECENEANSCKKGLCKAHYNAEMKAYRDAKNAERPSKSSDPFDITPKEGKEEAYHEAMRKLFIIHPGYKEMVKIFDFLECWGDAWLATQVACGEVLEKKRAELKDKFSSTSEGGVS